MLMTSEIIDSDKFKEIALSVEESLKSDPAYKWINICNFTRKAYLLGAINALTKISSEKDIKGFTVDALLMVIWGETNLDKIIATEIEQMKTR
jgi:hypothetical protein